MTLQEWIDEQKAALERFASMWERNADTDPAHWPVDMERGEWDEQFRADEAGD